MTDDDKTFEVGRPVPLNLGGTHVHHSWTHGWSNGLINVVAYAGVGAWCHHYFVGDTFDPGNVLGWAWVTCWPLGILAKVCIWLASIGLWILGTIVVVSALVFAGYFLWKLYEGWSLKRWMKKQAARGAADAT